MPHRLNGIEALLDRNRRWADRTQARHPGFFQDLAKGQEPDFLYIGCADSRVPSDRFTAVDPGNLFVARNIANQVRPDDVALTSVVEYAVGVLKVEHVIVCGHTGCGGVVAALAGKPLGGALDIWLEPLGKLVDQAREELAGLEGEARVNRMVELNVRAQVESLSRFDAVRAAWDAGRRLTLHGWVYGLDAGRVVEQLSIANADLDTSAAQ